MGGPADDDDSGCNVTVVELVLGGPLTDDGAALALVLDGGVGGAAPEDPAEGLHVGLKGRRGRSGRERGDGKVHANVGALERSSRHPYGAMPDEFPARAWCVGTGGGGVHVAERFRGQKVGGVKICCPETLSQHNNLTRRKC
jgi:hypothetical protein